MSRSLQLASVVAGQVHLDRLYRGAPLLPALLTAPGFAGVVSAVADESPFASPSAARAEAAFLVGFELGRQIGGAR